MSSRGFKVILALAGLTLKAPNPGFCAAYVTYKRVSRAGLIGTVNFSLEALNEKRGPGIFADPLEVVSALGDQLGSDQPDLWLAGSTIDAILTAHPRRAAKRWDAVIAEYYRSNGEKFNSFPKDL